MSRIKYQKQHGGEEPVEKNLIAANEMKGRRKREKKSKSTCKHFQIWINDADIGLGQKVTFIFV